MCEISSNLKCVTNFSAKCSHSRLKKCHLSSLNDFRPIVIWLVFSMVFPGGLDIKNLPAMWDNLVQSLSWEDSLEKGMATHFNILAWRIPMDRRSWWATFHEVAKSQMRLNTAQKHLIYFWNSHQAAAKILKTSS